MIYLLCVWLQLDREFGQEPDFEYTGAELPADYRSDWICELALENSNRITSVTEYESVYLTLESVEYIFTVSLSCCRFMRIHTMQVLTFLKNVKLSEKRRICEWEKVEANLSRQVTLRMLSSIQIASKTLSYHDSLSSTQVCSCLRSLGFAYTQRAALKSELRILKTLNFQLPRSPLIYSETLLKSVGSFWSHIDYKSIWEHVLLFLDVVYEAVLKAAVADNNISVPRVDIERVKADWMLLAGGVVAAASMCVLTTGESEQMVADLSKLSGTPSEDITQMADSITQITVSLASKSKSNETVKA
ncbi:hypothetical protein DICVIV_02532 [Dictyocaulus viviparus]|uniref:Cyclin N-terminal domain-containing protein n=1 Tax=Dictyocaulus viviparus TaxID=29172 RepID=A0A0D8Y5R9_DICVI|nr:hypothetical protein DICVIV_02532 [Dictyocaulus viviparus]